MTIVCFRERQNIVVSGNGLELFTVTKETGDAHPHQRYLAEVVR